jgi:hypothetical protein
VVNQSFGNILREIQVDLMGQPASAELEDAIINKLAGLDMGLPPGQPVPVYAVVTAPGSHLNAPEPSLDFEKGATLSDVAVVDQIHDTAEYVQQVLESGGRIFRVGK